MFRFAYMLLLIGPIGQGFPQEISNADLERVKDIYEIYSLLLSNPKTSHGPHNNDRYLIASTTFPGYPRVPCVQPPKERDADFRDVLEDYDRVCRRTLYAKTEPETP